LNPLLVNFAASVRARRLRSEFDEYHPDVSKALRETLALQAEVTFKPTPSSKRDSAPVPRPDDGPTDDSSSESPSEQYFSSLYERLEQSGETSQGDTQADLFAHLPPEHLKIMDLMESGECTCGAWHLPSVSF
jgi:hypothetical protein